MGSFIKGFMLEWNQMVNQKPYKKKKGPGPVLRKLKGLVIYNL